MQKLNCKMQNFKLRLNLGILEYDKDQTGAERNPKQDMGVSP
jgi:hypothetical protein